MAEFVDATKCKGIKVRNVLFATATILCPTVVGNAGTAAIMNIIAVSNVGPLYHGMAPSEVSHCFNEIWYSNHQVSHCWYNASYCNHREPRCSSER